MILPCGLAVTIFLNFFLVYWKKRGSMRNGFVGGFLFSLAARAVVVIDHVYRIADPPSIFCLVVAERVSTSSSPVAAVSRTEFCCY